MSSMKNELNELKRDVNISIISNEFQYTPNLSNLISYRRDVKFARKKILGLPIGRLYEVSNEIIENSEFLDLVKFISSNHDVIISGSCALKIFGLLERDVGDDIDIIANQENIDLLTNSYSERYNSGYLNMPSNNYDKTLLVMGVKVDVFLGDKMPYEVVDGIKVHVPFDVFEFKVGMNRQKDVIDLKNFIKLMREKLI